MSGGGGCELLRRRDTKSVAVCLCVCIIEHSVFLHVMTYRESDTTSAHRFARQFTDDMLAIRELLERNGAAPSAKL